MRSTTAFVRPLLAVPPVILGSQCYTKPGTALNGRNMEGRFIS
jgi:hypothetical protein